MSASLERARLLLHRGRYDDARREVRGVLTERPEDATAHATLALCELGEKRPDEALAAAREAVHLEPDAAFPHYVLAIVHLERDETAQALASARETLRIDPEDVDFIATLGRVHLARAEWKEALAVAEEGLALDAEDVDCSNTRSIALVKLGRRGAAEREVRAQLARDPLDSDTHATLGWQLLEQGQAARALHSFREALRLDPESEWAREGMIEAIKARNVFYRLLLKYMFWMSRRPAHMQWVVIIGAFILFGSLESFSRPYPALDPLIAPLILAYGLFALLTWVGQPLSNLFLRLHPMGRLALSREQVRAANVVGLILGVLVFAAVTAFLTSGPRRGAAFCAALYALGLVIPVSGYYDCERAGRRVITVLLAAQVVVGLTGLAAWRQEWFLAVAVSWFLLVIATPWIVNYLS